MYGALPEVSLRFRLTPVFAVVAMAALWPFGVPFGVVGLVFGLGLLALTAMLGMPRSIDLVFGMVLTLTVFATQFLGAVFLGMEAGGATTPVVLATVLVWFAQLGAFGVDVHRHASPVIRAAARPTSAKDAREASGTAA